MSSMNMIQKIYGHNENIDINIARAIMQDIVEINLGLDYGATNDKSDEELYGLYCLLSLMPKDTNSAKAKLLNNVKTMSEAKAKTILDNE